MAQYMARTANNILITAVISLALSACSNDTPAEQPANAEVASSAEDTPHPGEMIFMQCAACHSVLASDGHKIGPNLAGIVDRDAGTAEGFTYSDGMGKVDLVWTEETLDRFLKNPNEVIPGTTMIFVGVPDDTQRKALIDYLAQHAE